MKKLLTTVAIAAALLTSGSIAEAGALEDVVNNERNRGETCNRLTDTEAMCSLRKNKDMKSLFTVIPGLRRLGSTDFANEYCQATVWGDRIGKTGEFGKISESGDRELLTASALIDYADAVVIQCTYVYKGH